MTYERKLFEELAELESAVASGSRDAILDELVDVLYYLNLATLARAEWNWIRNLVCSVRRLFDLECAQIAAYASLKAIQREHFGKNKAAELSMARQVLTGPVIETAQLFSLVSIHN